MAYGILNVDQIVPSVVGSSLGAGNASTLKNRIINGAMVISQYNGTSSVTPTNNAYVMDRYAVYMSAASKFTTQQSTTAPAGFNNSLLVTSSSAYSIGSSDFFGVYQRIEGYNVADLGWGTANVKTVTLSFWVQSSLTGTFGGSFINGSFNYSYPFTYSIPVANTWTQISVTIAGPTSGTWNITNAIGLVVIFGLGMGSTYSGTAGSWSANQYFSATGATSLVGTNGATFYITGVQLEVGSSATGFEYRQYTTELALCQRYGLPVSGSFTGFTNGTTVIDCSMTFPVPMRTAPTAGSSTASVASCVTAGGATSTQSALSFTFPSAGVVSSYGATVRFSNFTGLTSGQAAYVYTNATTPAGFLTAEL
jgi:hypothetical protein